MKDASLAGTNPAQGEPSAEQVAAMLGLVAAGSFEATIKAQGKLLAQLLPALAAREELLGRTAAGALPAHLARRQPGSTPSSASTAVSRPERSALAQSSSRTDRPDSNAANAIARATVDAPAPP